MNEGTDCEICSRLGKTKCDFPKTDRNSILSVNSKPEARTSFQMSRTIQSFFSPTKTHFTYHSPPKPQFQSQITPCSPLEKQVSYPIFPVYEIVYEERRVDVKSPLVASRILKESTFWYCTINIF